MPRVLILACGNRLRCDDGLAWYVARELSRLPLGRDVEIITQHQLTPELALPVSQSETVVFVDAAGNGIPGEISAERLERRPSSVFSHSFTPAAVLSLSQQLYGTCPAAWTISLCGECFDHGEELSPTIKNKLPRMVQRIADLARAASSPVASSPEEQQAAGAACDRSGSSS